MPPSKKPPTIGHKRTVAAVSSALLLTVVVVTLLHSLTATTVNAAVKRATATVNPTTTANPTATATATSTPQTVIGYYGTPAELAYVNSLIDKMSLQEEIGQMIVVDFLGTTMTPDLQAKIEQYHVGGAIFYNRNITSMSQIRALTAAMQSDASQSGAQIPLLLAVDQEGGTVNRLSAIVGATPSAESVGASNNPSYARKLGEQDAKIMAEAGLNVNLAPVVDVQGVPDSQTYMQYRMYGWTPQKVAQMAGAYLAGLEQSGQVAGTLEHFPGLGYVAANPHKAVAVNNQSVAQLNSIDWAPYQSLIATGQVGLIMTTHIVVPAVDPSEPATLSYPLVTGILRDQLGYEGVIMTDDLYMAGVAANYTFPQRVLGAVLAGHDMVCSMFQLGAVQWAEQILQNAVADGQLTKARIDESVRRILLLKLQYGLLKMPQSTTQG